MAQLVTIASETDALRSLQATLEKQFFGGGLEFYRTYAEATRVFRLDPVDVIIGATQLENKEFLWEQIQKHFLGASVVLIMTNAPQWNYSVHTSFDASQKPIYKIMATQGVEYHLNNVVTNFIQKRRSVTRILQRK